MTSTGRIIVNDVYASCHNIMQANSIGQPFFWLVEKANNFYDRFFSTDPDEIIETPIGLSTILEMSDLVLPKKLVTI
ncbi:hypothetical protein PENTCL1PPCAC_29476 [Pristionchus entomophagus]|uniref:Cytochrome P450 n=1 Tax=Pristionchus entomophagus TaxID=358040 RepID=A0AAV5ULX2_9BILA|nr:hypothetical protein PENTCL1PPCAC_29476 [Pristionchus entomophagus]